MKEVSVNQLPFYFMAKNLSGRLTLLLCAAALLAGCKSNQDELRDFSGLDVTMPNGKIVRVEVMQKPIDMGRGMMFRDSLPPDHGMLFLYAREGNYPNWMYQVKIPLDILWLDHARRVVQILPNTPPCPSKSAKECPNFGGTEKAQYVLELAAGMADKYGVHVGSELSF